MPPATQDFDGVVAPALPAAFTFDPPYATTTSPSGLAPLSAPNVLAFTPASNGTYFATSNAVDTSGGDVSGAGYVGIFAASGHPIRLGLTARLSSSSPTLATASGYTFWLDWAAGAVGIGLLHGGSDTPLASLSATPPTGWVKLAWSVVGTTLALAVQRLSDGDWLQPGGSFGTTAGNCLTATDSTISGAGAWGLYTVQSGTGFTGYFDSLELDAPGGSGPLLPPWRMRRPPRRPAGGSARILYTPREVGSVYQTPHRSIVRPAARRGDELVRRRRGRVRVGSEVPVPVPPAVALQLSGVRPVHRPGNDQRQARRLPGAIWPPPNSGQTTPPYVPPYVPPLPGVPLVWTIGRRRPRVIWRGAFVTGPGYNVYAGPAGPDRIDYLDAIESTTATSWTTGPLAPARTTWFGVRAVNGWGEERNLDCALAIVLDAEGNDITNRPASPLWYRAFAVKGGAVKVEWTYPTVRGPREPVEFHVYIGAGVPSYSLPAAIVPANAGFLSMYQVTIAGLADATAYGIAVRASNAYGEDPGTDYLTATADRTGPGAVDGLTAALIA